MALNPTILGACPGAGARLLVGWKVGWGPLGDQLLVAHQLVAGVLVWLVAVVLKQVGKPLLHCGEHGMVLVHGEPADLEILREHVEARNRGVSLRRD